MSFSIGVDLGGTNLRAAAISETGVVLDRVSVPTEILEGREKVVADMVAAIREVMGRRGGEVPVGIGIGVPGIIDMKRGMVHESPNLPGFEDFPVRDLISRELGAPVLLENDANAAALGEQWQGAGRGVNDLMLFTLGTGIGGGIIYHGRILHGFLGMAGEVGHITVVSNGNPCACGNRGCLEKHASATAVSTMGRLMGFGEVTAKEVFDHAAAGDPRALEIFRVVGEALGTAIATAANLFNFSLYLLGGGLLPAWPYFAPAMEEGVRRQSYVFRNSGARVGRAELGSDAGLFGAAYLPYLRRD